MANGAPAWMAAVPCRRSEALHDAAPRDPRLSDLAPSHRRELVSLTALALMSSVSMLVLASGLIAPAAITATPLAIQFASLAHAPASMHVTARNIRIAVQREAPDASVASSRIAFERKDPGALRRVLFGTGEHRVRPFPTAAE